MADQSEYRAAVVAMAGAGQLAQMTQQAAISLGVELKVLAENRLRHEDDRSVERSCNRFASECVMPLG